MIEEANARSERTEECWPIAELLRVKGELLLLQGATELAPESMFDLRLGAAVKRANDPLVSM